MREVGPLSGTTKKLKSRVFPILFRHNGGGVLLPVLLHKECRRLLGGRLPPSGL